VKCNADHFGGSFGKETHEHLLSRKLCHIIASLTIDDQFYVVVLKKEKNKEDSFFEKKKKAKIKRFNLSFTLVKSATSEKFKNTI